MGLFPSRFCPYDPFPSAFGNVPKTLSSFPRFAMRASRTRLILDTCGFRRMYPLDRATGRGDATFAAPSSICSKSSLWPLGDCDSNAIARLGFPLLLGSKGEPSVSLGWQVEGRSLESNPLARLHFDSAEIPSPFSALCFHSAARRSLSGLNLQRGDHLAVFGSRMTSMGF